MSLENAFRSGFMPASQFQNGKKRKRKKKREGESTVPKVKSNKSVSNGRKE